MKNCRKLFPCRIACLANFEKLKHTFFLNKHLTYFLSKKKDVYLESWIQYVLRFDWKENWHCRMKKMQRYTSLLIILWLMTSSSLLLLIQPYSWFLVWFNGTWVKLILWWNNNEINYQIWEMGFVSLNTMCPEWLESPRTRSF